MRKLCKFAAHNEQYYVLLTLLRRGLLVGSLMRMSYTRGHRKKIIKSGSLMQRAGINVFHKGKPSEEPLPKISRQQYHCMGHVVVSHYIGETML